MTDAELAELVSKAVAAVGYERVSEQLAPLVPSESESRTLTLVSNAGVHTIPPEYLRGEVFEVSRGSWAAETPEEVHSELRDLLSGLARKLRSRPWRKVFLIPTGHPILTIHIKLLVYRLLRINTIDFYYRSGEYIEVELDHREISLATEEEEIRDDGTNV